MTTRVVYTAITNDHAKLCAHPEMADTDFVCFSDISLDRTDWQIRPIEAPFGLSPRMRAKFHKLFPPKEYEWSVWMDGSHVLNTSVSPSRMMDEMIAASPSGFGMHAHPERNCIYAEAEVLLTMRKCAGQPIAEQIAHYTNLGHPTGWGLWACGSMCRVRSPVVLSIMEMWWSEITRWSVRDQLSLPVVMRSLGSRPDEWPWNQSRWHPAANPHFLSIDWNDS